MGSGAASRLPPDNSSEAGDLVCAICAAVDFCGRERSVANIRNTIVIRLLKLPKYENWSIGIEGKSFTAKNFFGES